MIEDKLVEERLGLSIPYEWWPAAPLLKEFEAAGFRTVQIPSPPPSVLVDARHCARHAGAVREALDNTALLSVVHGPGSLRAGSIEGDTVFEGLLAYAAELGARHVVYHGASHPDAPSSEDALLAETRSLARLAERAERLDVTIA
ncbi:MAG: TIM barrel protein, partial [Solirubrobacterales bacterium]